MTMTLGNVNQLDSQGETALESDLLTALLRGAQELVTGGGSLHCVQSLLQELGGVTGVSRVWIFQVLALSEDEILQDYVFEWAKGKQYVQIGLPHFNHFRSSLANPEYAELVFSRQRGEYQAVLTDRLQESWLKDYLAKQSIRSMLTIPIVVDNQWWGTLGLDDCEREQEWSASEITLLRTASYLISSAIVKDNLWAKQRQLEIIKQSSYFSTWEVDVRRGFCWCTPEILGRSNSVRYLSTYTSLQWLRRIHPQHRKVFFRHLRGYLSGKLDRLCLDIEVCNDSGEYCWVDIRTNQGYDIEGSRGVIAGVMWDITERKRREAALESQAVTDPLTGLNNRRQFDQDLHQLVKTQQHTALSLLVVDIDYFKSINDQHGHQFGDLVLKHLASIFSGQALNMDYIYRIGGEEFACLLPDIPLAQAEHIAQALCQAVYGQPICIDGTTIRCSISIGCAQKAADLTDGQSLFHHADQALYQAKNRGRNQVVAAYGHVSL
ncbi:diguanylate cyclase [Vibrio sp. JPW-9-11-11]|uniref:sensor domain-containing diguanylate cyclase n=1 Tax=Vibrio sp. JPW-9-11-11 TaxID=1416532 RepID=UPI00159409DA|nr:sensor domain-containing diguanylate cyclase [Vibrio sp. JPW-9-11-11]NVD08652.1 diguanylate cyclase [Vibrio sp. JPW-9-11-11]